MNPAYYQLAFNGKILRRGFWIYVWHIEFKSLVFVYVGRTGDSSSCFAASPFSRVGQHLDTRKNAKANCLTRQLRRQKVDPQECRFTMHAFGPLFPEDRERHVALRDKTAAIEFAISQKLKERNYHVIGNHGSKHEADRISVESVWRRFLKHFPLLKTKNKSLIAHRTSHIAHRTSHIVDGEWLPDMER